MKIVRKIHTVYGMFIFCLLFVILLPFFLIPILFPGHHRLVGILNRIWAKALFILSFLPYKVDCRTSLDKSKQYIFCPNHFSYLDIPTMGLNPVNAIFVGKNEIENIPLFGFMYRSLHITVDRAKLKSRVNTFHRAMDALAEGKSLVIFPECGIYSKHPPEMAPFKDGAFRAAIEKQIPIVPVTIPHNWIILPDGPVLLNAGRVEVIFHEPVSAQGYTLDQIDALRARVREAIEHELKLQTARNEYRQEDLAQDRSPVSAGNQA
jgi:1-acyl-sn-glycerol-3-phosphate acyltransferase